MVIKKIFIVLMCCVFLFLLIGCKKQNKKTNSENKTSSTQSKTETATIEVIEKTELYSVKYDNANFMYEYLIYDNKGNILETDVISRQPNISLKNDIICKWCQWGTGTLVRGTDFYDVNTGQKSPHYSGIVDSYNNLVANSTNKSVVISDMFTGRVLQVIENFSKELYGGVEPIVDLKFIEDGTKVEITYLPVGYENTTEIFEVDITQQLGSDNELLSVMRNEKSFFDEKGNQTYFRDYDLGFSQTFVVKAEKYVIFDIDDDCKNELIVGIKNVDNFIILDHDEGNIYGHNTWLRAFNCLNNNGAFLQSGGAGLNSIASIEFDKTNKKIIEIAEINDYDKIYKHYGEVVSRETVDEVFDSFDNSQQCEWTLEE